MKLKPEVNEQGVAKEIWYALGVAQGTRPKDPFVVTSLKDGKHSDHSLHYNGLACDLRTHDLSKEQLIAWISTLKKILEPGGFDVVLEVDHIHIEYDPKPGEKLFERL